MREQAQELAKPVIKQFEGLSLQPYLCPAGKRTIGWGHVVLPYDKIDGPITIERAESLLSADTRITCKGVLKNAEGVELSDNQLAALVSFAFNLGVYAFAGSTLCKCIKSQDWLGASFEFTKWVYATVRGEKVVLDGLVRRRATERELFDRG